MASLSLPRRNFGRVAEWLSNGLQNRFTPVQFRSRPQEAKISRGKQNSYKSAGVAELEDALGLSPSGGNTPWEFDPPPRH